MPPDVEPSPSSSIGQSRISKFVSERSHLMACVVTGAPFWLSFRSSVEMLHLIREAINVIYLMGETIHVMTPNGEGNQRKNSRIAASRSISTSRGHPQCQSDVISGNHRSDRSVSTSKGPTAWSVSLLEPRCSEVKKDDLLVSSNTKNLAPPRPVTSKIASVDLYAL